jgi:phosphoenolpyruvate-protein kinase (PTS system EI component)
MPPVKLMEIKSLIRLLNKSKCQEIAEHILQMSRRGEIEEYLAMFPKEASKTAN